MATSKEIATKHPTCQVSTRELAVSDPKDYSSDGLPLPAVARFNSEPNFSCRFRLAQDTGISEGVSQQKQLRVRFERYGRDES
ncbi:MAG TPA: hypothetical protein VEV41_04330, partial [Terriglobales bacterium]|nr:hypothetical protein [Terriglobales bacterium]